MNRHWIERIGKSVQAREKFADHLMAVRTGLSVALFAAISVTLMLAIVKRIDEGAPALTWWQLLKVPDHYQVESFVWLGLCVFAFAIIGLLGKTAAQIYDSIDVVKRDQAQASMRKARWSR